MKQLYFKSVRFTEPCRFMRYILAIFFPLLITINLHAQTATAPTSGDGSSSNPYQIATVNNLYWLSQNSSYWGNYYIQTANISVSGISNFAPIGNSTTQFTGSYNGNGHTISGLAISRTGSYTGLFGYASGATITKFGITNASITGVDYAGILCGLATGNTSITLCFARGMVMSTGSSVGGLVGELQSSGSLSNCYFIGNVSGNTGSGNGNTGGLIGFNYGTVSYSYASATITGNYPGGLLGNSTTVATSSYYNSSLCSSGSTYATPKTATELTSQSTFSGWDFTSTWAITSGINSNFPFLIWLRATVTTEAVTKNNTGTTVTGNGNLTSLGGANPTAHGVCYSTSTSPTTSDSVVNKGVALASGAYTASITGLTPNTGYYLRAYATNAYGTVYGSQISFTSLAIAPTVTTSDAGNITSTGATFNGTVNANNASSTVTFEYGTTTSFGTSVTATQSPVTGFSATEVSYTLTSLEPNTTYYVRAVAVNSAGTSYGDTISFITRAITPTVTTSDASNITSTGATLNGTVNANNAISTVTFEYGTTTHFGASVTATESPIAGNLATPVSYTISGLESSTTYYVRVVSVNSAGTSYGDTISFYTIRAGSGTGNDPYLIKNLTDLRWLSENNVYWSNYFIQTADIDADTTRYWNSGAGFSPIGNGTTNFTGSYNGRGHAISGLYISRSSTDYAGLFGYIGSGGTVDSVNVEADSITGQAYVGGLAGYNRGAVKHCHTTGVVTGISSTGGFIGYNCGGTVSYSYSGATANSNYDAGGFTGTNNGSISYCYATGNSNGNTSGGYWTSGGLVGYNESGSTISNCFATGNVFGYSNVGGLVGANSGTTSYSYATGAVTGTSNTGGLAGSNSGTVTGCFYNNEIFTGSTGYGTGKTTDEMKIQSTYANWNFDTIWCMSSNTNKGYPFLQALEQGMYVITEEISDTSYNKVMASGALRNMSGQTALAYGFCWGDAGTLPTIADSRLDLGTASSEIEFATVVTGLSPGTSYHIRAYIITVSDTIYGGMLRFTTKPEYPEVTTLVMGSITATTAIANGKITWVGASNITAYGFCWSSVNTLPTVDDNITDLGNTTTVKEFTGLATGLSSITHYYLRAYATNASGTVYGNVVRFHTVLFGSGTGSDPYRIKNLTDLRWLSENNVYWNNYFIQTADIDADTTRYWNSGAGFSPIGNGTTNFTGSYNGAGHTIRGLYISRSSTDYAGLFGYIGSGGTVDSLDIETATITGKGNVGGLAGYNRGTVKHCHTTGVVTGISSTGGFIGYNNGGTVSYSYSEATANSNYEAGGFTGTNNGSISYCYATGNSNGNTSGGYWTSGGLVGYNESGSTISNCFATGKVSGYSKIGGLVGSNSGTTSYSYATGAVTGTSNTGGLAGSSSGTVAWCFYNNEIFTGSTGYGTGKTTDEMKIQSTYTNWDFDTIWGMSFNTNNGYPFLQGLEQTMIVTGAISDTSFNKVTASGALRNMSRQTALAYGFCWGDAGTLPTIADSRLDLGTASSEIEFTAAITGLLPGTSYHIRAYIITVSDTTYGGMLRFTTKPEYPEVTTLAMRSITATTAIANGKITWVGASDVTAYGFCWSSVNTLPTVDDNMINLGKATTIKEFSGLATGLSSITHYYLRAYATNAFGTVYGNVVRFHVVLYGSGTSSDPYRVTNLSDLEWLSENSAYWGNCFVQTANIDASDTKSWNSGAGFTPIGNSTTNFTGSYNGAGHTISGLYINRSSTGYNGLFGFTIGATLDNIRLVNCAINGYVDTGGLVGVASNSTIEYCSSSGNVSGTASQIGGLVGHIVGQYSTVQYCYSSCNVSGTGSKSGNIGGLVGYGCSYSTVQYCYSTGSVSGYNSVGGLIGGYNTCDTVRYCYSTGNVSADICVGGLIGYSYGDFIQYCYSTGRVSGASNVYGLIGRYTYYTPQYCYWDKQNSGQSVGCSRGNSYIVGLSTPAMKNSGNLSYLGSFSTTWGIREDSTYAVLRGINNNAPFAFADTVSGSFQKLLDNDFDYEMKHENLIMGVEYAVSLITGTVYTGMLQSIANGDSLKVRYRVGELLTAGDTLWGNTATSILVLVNSVPAFSTASLTTAEDTPAQLRITATDADGDRLRYSVITTVNGTATISNDTLVYIPNTNFYGNDSVQIAVSDLTLSDTVWVYITVTSVNDAPVITSTASVDATEYVEYTYTVATIDADDDTLTYSLVNAPAGMFIDNNVISWIPAEGVLTSGCVILTVSDGKLSDTETIFITVTPVDYVPVARDTAITTSISAAVSLNLPVSDIDGTISKTYIEEDPSNGTANISGTTLTYTPDESFSGNDTITWFAKDSEGLYSNTATLVISVIKPIAVDIAVSDTIITAGTDACFDAQNEITVAGPGSTVVIENNASASFIAGVSIRFLPGFHAETGSYVHGWITVDGSFCDAVAVSGSVVAASTEKSKVVDEQVEPLGITTTEKNIKVYPNPNNGQFTLEMENIGSGASVCFYNIQGSVVYQLVAGREPMLKINLPGINKGICFLKVTDKQKQFTKKILIN